MTTAILVGCGAMSRAWLAAAAQIDGLKTVGLVDLELERARSRAAEFGLDDAAVGVSAVAMIDDLRHDDVEDDVVPQARASVVLPALARGRHVLTEKPLAASLAAAQAIVAAARDAGRVHAVVQNRRYLAGIRRIRRFLDVAPSAGRRASMPTSSSPRGSAGSGRRWRIVGERGSLVWDGFEDVRAQAIADVGDGASSQPAPVEVPPVDPRDRVGGHLGVMQDFVAAIRGGPPPETSGSGNLRSLAMVFGAIRSAETGLPVDVEA